ncbi:UNVERIFIED_ORG: hypothetical protein ABIC43_000124 [Variovorax guangxiensis]
MTTELRYLDFDYSEDTEGHGTFDAMASTSPDRTPEVRAEIARVLAWAEATFPGARGALDEGATWDCDLQESSEDNPRYDTITLSISGTADFCAALRERFGLD